MFRIPRPPPAAGPLCAAVLVLISLPAQAEPSDTLYLCKAYSGGQFWSARPCGERQALIERTVSVPAGMAFAQQVRLGEQARAEGDRLHQPARSAPAPASPRPGGTSRDRHADDCAALQARVDKLDTQAHQPQSGARQDKLAAQKRAVRDKQAKRGC
jgi:hypothetical protein